MRCLKRNMQKFWYCLYESSEEILDEYGNATGQMAVNYDEAVEMTANVSPATGQAQVEMFGDLDSYDKVIVTDQMDCPIDEQTVLFIDKEPEYDTETVEADDPQEDPTEIKRPKYDYIVKRVAKSINSIAIAVRKVEVGS